MHAITLDIETRRLASECGGWNALKRGEGGASAIVIWAAVDCRPHLFDDNCIDEVVSFVENADLLLSFNGVEFDVPILEGLYGRQLRLDRHLDLLQLIWEALADTGRRRRGNSLNDVALRTLGHGKTGNGAHAPELSDSGQFGTLFNYCLDDTLLTRDLFQFVQTHGGIIDINGDMLELSLPNWFTKAKL